MSAVNDLAQLWIWKIEIRVLGTLVAACIWGSYVIVYWLWGYEAASWVLPIAFAGIGVALVCAVLYALECLVFGADPKAATARSEEGYRRALKIIGADQRFDD
jgi:hypothetical protein